MTKLLIYQGGASGQFLSFMLDPTYDWIERNNEYFGKVDGRDYIYDRDKEVSIERCKKICTMHEWEWYGDYEYLKQYQSIGINVNSSKTNRFVVLLGALKTLLNNNFNYHYRGDRIMSLIHGVANPKEIVQEDIKHTDISLEYDDIFILRDPVTLQLLIDFFESDTSLTDLTYSIKAYHEKNLELVAEHGL